MITTATSIKRFARLHQKINDDDINNASISVLDTELNIVILWIVLNILVYIYKYLLCVKDCQGCLDLDVGGSDSTPRQWRQLSCDVRLHHLKIKFNLKRELDIFSIR